MWYMNNNYIGKKEWTYQMCIFNDEATEYDIFEIRICVNEQEKSQTCGCGL